jgi:leucyl aminopeptidase
VRKLVESNPKNIKEVKVVKGQQLVDLGMNLLHAVGKGATSEPRCVAVYYKGNPASDEVEVALVGKGITFDTGGLHLKTYGNMEQMYLDKGGACSVIGALHGAMELGLKINAVFAMGLAENAIDAKSYKPMDIITSLKGYTVEIDNTDAEGRLILADTFTFVQREFKPKRLIDLATLTGAIRIALGLETAGLFSNDDDFAQEISSCGHEVFEKTWRMPIPDESRDQLLTPTADLVNSYSSPMGGASRAAAFLERFVEKGVKWIHLDIAGAFDHMKGAKAPLSINGNGFGVQTLLNYLYKNQQA